VTLKKNPDFEDLEHNCAARTALSLRDESRALSAARPQIVLPVQTQLQARSAPTNG
jgi:hypothetical protein